MKIKVNIKLDNSSRILKIYLYFFLMYSFIKIFAIEISVFLKNNFLKITYASCNLVFSGVGASLGLTSSVILTICLLSVIG